MNEGKLMTGLGEMWDLFEIMSPAKAIDRPSSIIHHHPIFEFSNNAPCQVLRSISKVRTSEQAYSVSIVASTANAPPQHTA